MPSWPRPYSAYSEATLSSTSVRSLSPRVEMCETELARSCRRRGGVGLPEAELLVLDEPEVGGLHEGEDAWVLDLATLVGGFGRGEQRRQPTHPGDVGVVGVPGHRELAARAQHARDLRQCAQVVEPVEGLRRTRPRRPSGTASGSARRMRRPAGRASGPSAWPSISIRGRWRGPRCRPRASTSVSLPVPAPSSRTSERPDD